MCSRVIGGTRSLLEPESAGRVEITDMGFDIVKLVSIRTCHTIRLTTFLPSWTYVDGLWMTGSWRVTPMPASSGASPEGDRSSTPAERRLREQPDR